MKLDETTTVEFELTGEIPEDALVTAKRENAICDLSWGNNRKSDNGIIMSLNITGILVGETPITVCFKERNDIGVTITVKVINEPGTISFMGIPWDITPEEFDQALQDKGLEFTKKANYSSSDSWFRFEGMPFEPPYSSDIEIKSKSFSYKSSKNTEYRSYPLVKVAGYSVDYIYAKFKPSYSYERKRVGEPYRLARASYSIYESDIPKEMTVWEAYDDLTAKLTKLYGEPKGSEKGSYYTVKTTWWHAEDGTGVSLTMRSSIGVYSIEIEYGVADESAYLNNVYAIRQWEKQQVVDGLSDDVGGL
ncbi:MAG: hypothetical protein K6A68_13795 [Clostridiales bacterium]|nr:hypothetical protein [Clostridiales bacterium]